MYLKIFIRVLFVAALIVLVANCGIISGSVTYRNSFFWLVAANRNSSSVSVYSINATSGAVSPTSQGSVSTPASPLYLEYSPNGSFLYIPHFDATGDVSAFTFSPTTGFLTSISGTPFQAPAASAQTLFIHPSGQFVYVESNGFISAYNSTTNNPSLIGNYAIAANSYAVIGDPQGQFLYADDGTPNLYGYSINPNTGGLSPISGFPINPGAGSAPVLGIDRFGNYLFASNASAQVRVFGINRGNGTVSLVQGPITITGDPFSFGIDPQNQFVIIPDIGNNIYLYSFNSSTGILTPCPSSPYNNASETFRTATFDPSGQFLYVSDNALSTLYLFSFNRSTCVITPLTQPTFPLQSRVTGLISFLTVQ